MILEGIFRDINIFFSAKTHAIAVFTQKTMVS